MILDRGLIVPNFLCVVVLSPCVTLLAAQAILFLSELCEVFQDLAFLFVQHDIVFPCVSMLYGIL